MKIRPLSYIYIYICKLSVMDTYIQTEYDLSDGNRLHV